MTHEVYEKHGMFWLSTRVTSKPGIRILLRKNVRGVRMLCGSTGFPISFTEPCSVTSHPHKLETTQFRTVDIC